MSEFETPRDPDLSRDEDALAYVLGITSEAERRGFADGLRSDPALAAKVAAWNERLAPLAGTVPPVVPARDLLPEILQRIDVLDENKVVAFRGRDELAGLRRSRTVWRGIAVTASALAAALALALGLERAVQPPDRTFVAAINRSGDLPALIVRVNAATGIVQVRSVSVEVPSDRALELWSVVAGTPPRSLGVVSSGPATKLRLEGDTTRLRDGITVAASVEPKGGSPTGLPTGPVVYSGRLIAETP